MAFKTLECGDEPIRGMWASSAAEARLRPVVVELLGLWTLGQFFELQARFRTAGSNEEDCFDWGVC